jgi:plasmid maintenance system killer protein
MAESIVTPPPRAYRAGVLTRLRVLIRHRDFLRARGPRRAAISRLRLAPQPESLRSPGTTHYDSRVANLDALYRVHAPAIAASLARSFGARRLDLIEAAVQEAFVSAIESWGADVPARPGAWLQVAARRRLVDALRRAKWTVPGEALDEFEAPDATPCGDEDLLRIL